MLDRFELKPTDDTPEIILDPQNKVFKMSGRSMPEDAFAFYSPVLIWLSEYIKNPNERTDFICNMEYFNSSSAKKIVELFFVLEEIKDTDIRIFWHYERDDRLIESKGLELKTLLKIPVAMVVID